MTINGEFIAFFFLAIFALGGAILLLFLTKVVHMVVALGITFLSIAGIYVLLHAEFIAFAQVLIYGGAIAIIMLFGIMLTKHDDQDETRNPLQKLIAMVSVVAFFILTLLAINTINWKPQESALYEGNTTNIGMALFTKYVIPFELTSVVLLVALVGAIILAKRDDKQVKEGESHD